MPSIYDVYEFYLEAGDLKEKAHVVVVDNVKTMETFIRSVKEKKIVMRFVNRRKAMILNKTQAGKMTEIAGTDDYTKWRNVEIVLTQGRSSNGRDTIVISDRLSSGDADLAFSLRPGWTKATYPESIGYAAKEWKVEPETAKARIAQAIKSEALSETLPESEFKEYVLALAGDQTAR